MKNVVDMFALLTWLLLAARGTKIQRLKITLSVCIRISGIFFLL